MASSSLVEYRIGGRLLEAISDSKEWEEARVALDNLSEV